MNDHSKVIDSSKISLSYLGPYQEIALYVRDLLKCDYALVAVPEKDSIRIQAIAGSEPETPINLAADLLSRLRDWGPVVVDDSRMIAVPVMCDSHIIGVIVGYSNKPGTSTANDLEKLLEYSYVAKGILVNAGSAYAQTPTNFRSNELLHFSRLITIGELSASFAHEVTNPLMLIRGHLKIAEESLPSEHPIQKNLEVIDRASRRIEEMAKRMLDFSKKRAARREAADIAEVISDSLRFIQPYFRAQPVDVQVHLEPGIPLVLVDRWQMVQAIVNIVKNAADAMSGLERRILSITACVEGTQLRIAITDTGPGISAANVEKIFEPFFTTKGERGTGLGLHITKQVIEEHGGTIQVQTSERGTIFLISLPL
jgi:signal transduction histidine kinase